MDVMTLGQARAQGDKRFGRRHRHLPGPRYAALGDSITRGNSTNAYTGGVNKYLDADAYHNAGFLKLGGRIVPVGNWGWDGQTSTEILARVGDVIAAAPDFCFVLAGANDPGAAISQT